MITYPRETQTPTFEEIARHEPQLLDLLRLARSCHSANKGRRDVSFDLIWYRRFKPQMSQLVGWERVSKTEHPIDLTSSATYCTCYDRIYNVLHGHRK